MTTVIVACAVRSYMLAVALVLIVFRGYLDLVDPTHGPIGTRARWSPPLSMTRRGPARPIGQEARSGGEDTAP